MRISSFKSRALALVASTAMLFGVGVATATIASAHTHEVSATCSTLTITLDSYASGSGNHKNVVTTWVDDVVVPAASSTDFGTTWHKTVAFNPTNVSHTWRVKVTAWDSSDYSFDQSGKTSGCETPKTVTVPTYVAGDCNTPPSANYADTNTFWTLAKTGSAGFGNTLVLDYTAKAGYTLTGTTHFTHTWGAAPDCRTISVPVAPTTVKPTCDSPTTVTLPTTTGVVYSQAIVGGNIVVTAVPADGYKFAGDSQVKKFYVPIEAQLKCVTAVTPVASGQVCTGPGQGGNGLLVITAVEGVSYTIEPGDVTVDGGSFPVAQPTDFTITASAKDGYVLQGDSVFHVSIVDPGACLVLIAPVAPSVTPPTCDAPGAMVPADGPTGVKYVVNEDGSVTATPEAGYRFNGDEQSITFLNTGLPQLKCVESVKPLVAPATCEAPGQAGRGSLTFTVPEGIVYDVTLDGDTPVDFTVSTDGEVSPLPAGLYHVTARALDGYTLTSETNTWDITIESAGDCIVVSTPVAPSVTAPSCDEPGSVVAAETTGVVYVTSEDGTTVTATPAEGYRFDGDNQSVTFGPYDIAQLKCVVAVPPTINPADCSTGETLTVPDTTGVVYLVDPEQVQPESVKAADITVGPGGVHTVVAYPADGYTLVDGEGNILDPQSVTFGPFDLAGPLKCVTPGVSLTQPKCPTNLGSITLDDVDNITYSNGSEDVKSGVYANLKAGDYTVIATADEGYVLQVPKGWTGDEESNSASIVLTLKASATPCATPTPTPTEPGLGMLPHTGGDVSGPLLAGGGLLGAGILLLLLSMIAGRRRQVRRQH